MKNGVERAKIVLFITSLLFVGFILLEKLIIRLKDYNVTTVIKDYWYVFPFILIVLIISIDEVRKRKFLKKLIKHPVFTYKIDYWIISLLICTLGYWLSSRYNLVEGVLSSKHYLFLILFSIIYILFILFRFFFIAELKNNSNRNVEKVFLDQPINNEGEDIFKRASFAKRLTNIINNNNEKESLVIGLYGKWGSGKTSVLNLIKNDISEKDNLISVPFNPWYFRDDEQLILQFFNAFINEIEKAFGGGRSELVKNLEGYSIKLAPITLKMGLLNFSFKDIKRNNEDIFTLREKIDRDLMEEGKRVVVLIDDLDRLDNKEIALVFKLVKLIADFKYISYILAFDEEIVSKAIADNYNHQGELGMSFLEKIIQIPIHLPPANRQEIRSTLLEGIEKILIENEINLSQDEIHRLISNWDRSFGKLSFTLRTIKRYLNSISFSVPLIKNEVNVVDLLGIEGIRIFFPKVYKFIYSHSKAFLTAGRSRVRDQINAFDEYKPLLSGLFGNYTEGEKYAITIIVNDLFPRSKFLFTGNNTYGSDWEKKWSLEQRICSEDYFQKYFLYNVEDGNISDQEYNLLLKNLQVGDLVKVNESINKVIEEKGFSNLITKLRYFENELSSESAGNLSICLASMASKIPDTDEFMHIFTSMGRATSFVNTLIFSQEEDKRLDLAITVIKKSTSLKFSVQVFYLLIPSEETQEERFTLEEANILAQEIIPIIKQEIENEDFLEENYPISVPILNLWSQWGEESEVRAAIGVLIDRDKGIERFLKAFTSKGQELETGIPVKGSFNDSNYEKVQKLYSTGELASKLLETYQMPKTYENVIEMNFTTEYEKIAKQFLLIHNKKQA
ncbi:KAP family P-loop NTPase fold protein [Guptibacillus algicola]|uniref:KAP family P-loop NTPase fold protein n=1 Tax=Guptibacillus algicola TaxID=225844 RepID=UPI001CD4480D|nr:P-loop NTPase fold protein [Alkalihalobacillus algicola]MCA0985714.1 KAP family NTPase [Alkalihalobacillus algicola]